jgi:hypothetical protein
MKTLGDWEYGVVGAADVAKKLKKYAKAVMFFECLAWPS